MNPIPILQARPLMEYTLQAGIKTFGTSYSRYCPEISSARLTADDINERRVRDARVTFT